MLFVPEYFLLFDNYIANLSLPLIVYLITVRQKVESK